MKPRNRIFLDKKIGADQIIVIKEKQAHYLINVLRCKVNENVLVFNEYEWNSEIISINSKTLELRILEKTKDSTDDKALKIYFSPLKRSSNEFLIQKCTEIGINIFQPLIMEHTNISKINTDRFKLIAIEAVEQSEQLIIPKINQAITFKKFIEQIHDDELVIACTVRCKKFFINHIVRENINKNISILIGPEGDFSKLELNEIKTHKNIVEASLGNSILKGETAAIVASALVKESYNLC